MSFIMDEIKKNARNELLKIDANHDGKPDVIQALEALDQGLDAFGAVLSRVKPATFERLLHGVNALLDVEDKMSAPDLLNYANAMAQAAPAVKYLDGHVEGLIANLKPQPKKK